MLTVFIKKKEKSIQIKNKATAFPASADVPPLVGKQLPLRGKLNGAKASKTLKGQCPTLVVMATSINGGSPLKKLKK